MAKAKKSIKRVATTIADRGELEQVLGEYAAQVLERDRLTVEMEQRIQEVRAGYEPQIAACCETGDGLFEDLHAWAALHPAEFGARKSLDLLHGTIGFRTCPPAVKQIKGVKVDHTLEALKARGFLWLLRTKEEVDKDAVLRSYVRPGTDTAPGATDIQHPLTDTDLKLVGLYVEKGETFYTDIKREDEKQK
jgi:phage host-nuclease inhibitor protein Gam